jgi:uncharacterized protein YneF (UPF0154 family)
LRNSLIIAMVVVLLIVITGGYFAYSYLSSQEQNNNPPETLLSNEQIRDQAMTYIAANYTQTIPLMSDLHWSGGVQDREVLGSETYQYTGGEWVMMVQYPIVPNPAYTINVICSASDGFYWNGTCIDGVIYQTGSSLIGNTSLTQEQVCDITLQYLSAYHNQTQQYMHGMSWEGGRINKGIMVGSETYSYQNSGWNVTMQYPVVPNPIYTISAQYAPMGMMNAAMMVDWQGTLQGGYINQTNYRYTP